MNNFDDVPIEKPGQDRLGFDPFARAISDCLRGIENPCGSVVAIYGPWGSGKSSAIKLVLHHLSKNAPDLNVINFPAWMYHTEEALTVAFFRELHAGLSSGLPKTLMEKVTKALQDLGTNLVGAKNLAGMTVGLFAGSLGEKATTATLEAISSFIGQGKTTDDLQATLADTLRKAEKKFLVVIDDLDRLSPEEALVIFRLVKSVGRLPNVMYLLAYDRERMEQAVKCKFPSEGAHYLEKIVQAGFELPRADPSILNRMMWEILDGLASDRRDIDPVEFGNLFDAIVAPELKTPRDVFRLANTLEITIAPVKSDVFLPDFVGIETLRVSRPAVYRAIRQNETDLTLHLFDPVGKRDRRHELSEKYTKMLLSGEPEADHEQLQGALACLFPMLGDVFNDSLSPETPDWARQQTLDRKRQRRICSSEHFDTYFRFSVSPETIHTEGGPDLDCFLDDSRTVEEIQDHIRDALEIRWANGRTKASYILDELTAHGSKIPLGHREQILTALFGIADELFVNKPDNFGSGSGWDRWGNCGRLYELLFPILMDRTTLDKQSEILARAMENASLRWHVFFSYSAWGCYHQSNPVLDPFFDPIPEPRVLTTKRVAKQLRERSLEMLRAADDGTLLSAPWPVTLLLQWGLLQPDGSDEVTQFTSRVMRNETGLCQLVDAILETSCSQDMEDPVQRAKDRGRINDIDQFLDVPEFRKRLNEALERDRFDEEQKSTVRRCLAALERREGERKTDNTPS